MRNASLQQPRPAASKGAEVATKTLDVTDADAMADWLGERDAARDVDLVIANAGMGGSRVLPTLSGEGGDLARAIVSVNTLGVINTIAPILPRMVARGSGHVAIIGSLAGAIGLPQSPAYSASKAAVHIYGDGLRRLVGRQGVRVTVVLPGFVDTPMSRSLAIKRPFLWSAERAADRIARDIARGAARSVFPLPLRLAVGLQHYLPGPLVDMILGQFQQGDGKT